MKEQNTSYAFDILTLRNREQELSRTLKKKDSLNNEFIDRLHNEIESSVREAYYSKVISCGECKLNCVMLQ